MKKVAKLLIINPDDKYLLMYRSDHPTFGKDPDLPGGTLYDEDDPGVGSAHNLQSGQPVAIPNIDERDADWFSRHEWKIV